MSIAENVIALRNALPKNVALVAVSKTKPESDIRAAYAAGQRDFGENKVQDMAAKAANLPADIRWHYIGHVQSNKIKYMAPFVHLVHGVDREKVLTELNKAAAKHNRIINCLLQVHIAQEQTKFGFDTAELKALFAEDLSTKYPHLAIIGLMGMATFTQNIEQIKAEFMGLSRLFDALQSKFNIQHASRERSDSGFNIQRSTFNTLSMGMSGDYQIAIDCGSNMVRIGTAIFGERNY